MKTIYKIFLAIIAISMNLQLYSQPMLDWARTYRGPIDPGGSAGRVVVDDSGYVYTNGNIMGSGNNNIDYCTIKYKSNGDSVWTRIYTTAPGDSFDVSHDMKVDKAGNVYVTGTTATIKYDKTGNLIWSIVSSTFSGVKIELDTLGYIYIGGYNNIAHFTMNKYNENGQLIWSTEYTGGGGYPRDMKRDNAGNIILTGPLVFNNFQTSYDYFTIKFNPSGDTLWTRSYDGAGCYPPDDFANAITVDDAGNIFVTGYSKNSNCGDDYLTIKYDMSGNPVWTKRYNSGGAYAIEADKSGNVFVAGVTGNNYTILKYDNIGNLIWTNIFPAYQFSTNVVVTLDSIGSIYVGGAKIRDAWADLMITKFNTNGIQLWQVSYPGIGNTSDEAYGIALDKSGNVYAAGKHYVTGIYNFLTVKYSQMVGIQPVSSEVPSYFQLYQNYPNPFNPITKIKFDIPSDILNKGLQPLVQIKVYDILGREIVTIVNESLKPGSYEAEFNGANLPSGVYFYRLEVRQAGSSTGDFVETKKMILVK